VNGSEIKSVRMRIKGKLSPTILSVLTIKRLFGRGKMANLHGSGPKRGEYEICVVVLVMSESRQDWGQVIFVPVIHVTATTTSEEIRMGKELSWVWCA